MPLSGPWVKPRTRGAVLRYCTTEMRSLFTYGGPAELQYSRAKNTALADTKISTGRRFWCKRFGASGGNENVEAGDIRCFESGVACCAIGLRAQTAAPAPATIAEKDQGRAKVAGYFNLYWDAKQGKLWLEIDKWDTEFLYQSVLAGGNWFE